MTIDSRLDVRYQLELPVCLIELGESVDDWLNYDLRLQDSSSNLPAATRRHNPLVYPGFIGLRALLLLGNKCSDEGSANCYSAPCLRAEFDQGSMIADCK